MDKRCSRCGVTKSFDEFSLNSNKPDGHFAWCKICESEYGKIRYQNKHESILEKARIFRQKHKAKILIYTKKTHEDHPEKYKAHTAVNNAVGSGKIKPASFFICSICNKQQARHYHHHKGYEEKYRLDVVAVCVACHKTVG